MHSATPRLYIVVYGNPADGFRHIGPFADYVDAERYMDQERSQQNLWIVELDAPAEDQGL
jgi:hypothetical protein